MKTLRLNTILIVLTCIILISCNCDDDNNDNDCPEVNNTYPLLLGNWVFTGTIINGNLLVEDCDLLTALEVTCNEFEYTSYGGENCSTSSTSISNYIIEGNNIIYLDEFGDDGFVQEIMTLNTTTLILKNSNGSSNDVVTENWTRQ